MKAEQAAFRIWPLLVAKARQHDTITYGDLSAAIESNDRRLNWPLERIQDLCIREGLPLLTILVVKRSDGRPNTGFTALAPDQADAGFETVWSHPWTDRNPFDYAEDGTTLDDLALRLDRNPGETGAVYARVARGVSQMLFRTRVLAAYRRRCAVCGVSFEECLDAAHIVPWAAASPEQRISPSNGLCLCANHHRLFDRGMLTIGPDGRVVCRDMRRNRGLDEDHGLLTAYHGREARLPSRERWRPGRDTLA